MGGFDNLPVADMAPVTISGHKAYGVFIAPGMGLRNNDTTGIAVGDQPEGMYWVLDGRHFNDGCCFDYGNANCVSFESVNKPGSYLRHQNFQFHLQPNDGSSLFSMDATFCPGPGNSGQGTSFQSVNLPGRYIRNFNDIVYLAANGGANPWDTATGWPADTSWLVATPWASAS
jgi:alpha-L-arabinofuranosidase B-like protein